MARDARRTFDNGVVVGFIQRDGSNQAHLAHLNPPVRPRAACCSAVLLDSKACPFRLVACTITRQQRDPRKPRMSWLSGQEDYVLRRGDRLVVLADNGKQTSSLCAMVE